jgi:hypothetical protein
MANAQVNVDFLENGRGGHYLLHAGFMFSVRTSRNNRRYCKCLSRDCLATIVTVDNLPVSFGVNHNHPSDHIGLAAASFSSCASSLSTNVSPAVVSVHAPSKEMSFFGFG